MKHKKIYKRRQVENDLLAKELFAYSTAENIFKEIDRIIFKNLKSKPIRFDESNFKKEYEKLKEKYLDEI